MRAISLDFRERITGFYSNNIRQPKSAMFFDHFKRQKHEARDTEDIQSEAVAHRFLERLRFM